ncbi:chorismate mutase [Gynuella sunshinyii]|uniref:chorismate mutase n=1 Tax=Gynuella sunshinyii YC6258 TaxID=1445510 RepID=A0A0C5VWT6_9GAMM|nr:chorismate mutase [Gynuella sunshinyii]AJQ94919.1 chorismate mutase [Gynuella sunshinyii YC6258]
MKTLLTTLMLTLLALQANADTNAETLFSTINKRLSYMEDVAIYKADNHLPIEDIGREATVIEQAKDAARQKGLDPSTVESFFQAQIAVAKAIQYRYRAEFLSHPTDHAARDLNSVVRPELLKLGDQIIEQIAQYQKQYGVFQPSQYDLFSQQINVDYISEGDKQLLFNALLKIRTQM